MTPNVVDKPIEHHPDATGAQYLAGVLGVSYLVAGLLGFAVTGAMGFTAEDPQTMMAGLGVNPLHNVVHAVAGALGIVAFTRRGWARLYGAVVLVVFGVLALMGFLGVGTGAMNVNGPDNWLHAGTAVLGLIMALVPSRARRDMSPRVTGSARR